MNEIECLKQQIAELKEQNESIRQNCVTHEVMQMLLSERTKEILQTIFCEDNLFDNEFGDSEEYMLSHYQAVEIAKAYGVNLED